MKKKYNLALMPMTKSKEVISIAQKFSSLADKYLLGINSFPHLTLNQFEIDEAEIGNIWNKVSKEWNEKPVELIFDKFSCVTFDNSVYWVALLPGNAEALFKMHEIIATIIEQPVKKSFDPHMTLINTRNKDYEREVEQFSKYYQPISDYFILMLGKCDGVGQFTEIIYQHEDFHS